MKIAEGKGREWAARALLVVVIGAPAAASWHGLTAAGRDALGLPGWWAALVPLVLDAAAAYAAVLALRDVLAGDAAGVNRGLVWVYAVGSAGLNAWHAYTVGSDVTSVPAALFYAAASISAVILWDRTLRAMRRDHLREQGAVSPPTPRFRLARWVVAPGETARAWRVAVVEGITDPAAAVLAARAPRAGGAPPQPRLTLDTLPPSAADPLPAVAELDLAPVPAQVSTERVLTAMTKADAVRLALDEAETPDGRAPRVIAEWLADRGVDVAPTYVSDVVRRDERSSKTHTDDGAPLRLAAS